MTPRIDRLTQCLQSAGLPALLVQDTENVRYLSGFTGSTAALVVTHEAAVFVTDGRYREQAARECAGLSVEIASSSGGYPEAIATVARRLGVERAGVEAETVTLAAMDRLVKALEGVRLEPVEDFVAALRRRKDEVEIEVMRRACELADRAFAHILTCIRPGRTEREIAVELEYFMKCRGAEREAFDTIVASGPRSALPHGRASDRPLADGDFITFDFGARLEGYHSDLTRTVVLGSATAEQRELYDLVLRVQREAVAALRPGVEGRAVHHQVVERFAAAGHAGHFPHGLGHSLGRTVHEANVLSARSTWTVEEGMVLTVEPGLYIEGWGGVRIEDDVVVRAAGAESLTHAPRELIEVSVAG